MFSQYLVDSKITFRKCCYFYRFTACSLSKCTFWQLVLQGSESDHSPPSRTLSYSPSNVEILKQLLLSPHPGLHRLSALAAG